MGNHGIYCEMPSYYEILLTTLKSTSVYVSLVVVILQSMNSMNISLILIMHLMLSMDIHPNPGPPIEE